MKLRKSRNNFKQTDVRNKRREFFRIFSRGNKIQHFLPVTFSSFKVMCNIFFSLLKNVIKCARKSIKNKMCKYVRSTENTQMKWLILRSRKYFFMSLFVHPPSHLLQRVQVVSSIQLSPKCEILQKKSVSKNVSHNTLVGSQMRLLKNVFKGSLKPKLHSSFYGVFSILWRKTLEQSFLAFSSDFTKL